MFFTILLQHLQLLQVVNKLQLHHLQVLLQTLNFLLFMSMIQRLVFLLLTLLRSSLRVVSSLLKFLVATFVTKQTSCSHTLSSLTSSFHQTSTGALLPTAHILSVERLCKSTARKRTNSSRLLLLTATKTQSNLR